MPANATTTVLYAQLDAASARGGAVSDALTAALTSVADSTGGLVLKRAGGKVMMLFATPDAAASAASKIHALPQLARGKASVHIGIHAAAPDASGKEAIDRTARLALKLAEQAEDGQTLTSKHTAEQLNPAFRSFSRCRHFLGADSQQTWLYELASWHQKGERPAGWSPMPVLRLTLRDRLVVCSREKTAVVIGRESGCDVIVENKAASRRHCTIQYADGQFAVRDHSRNGTYVTIAPGNEVPLHQAELSLPDEGFISIGDPREKSNDALEFCFALVS